MVTSATDVVAFQLLGLLAFAGSLGVAVKRGRNSILAAAVLFCGVVYVVCFGMRYPWVVALCVAVVAAGGVAAADREVRVVMVAFGISGVVYGLAQVLLGSVGIGVTGNVRNWLSTGVAVTYVAAMLVMSYIGRSGCSRQ